MAEGSWDTFPYTCFLICHWRRNYELAHVCAWKSTMGKRMYRGNEHGAHPGARGHAKTYGSTQDDSASVSNGASEVAGTLDGG